MSVLGDKQKEFAYQFAKLVVWIHEELGYRVAYGDGKRDKRVFGKWGEQKGYGRKWSNHKIKLAHDLDLFIDGHYQTTTEAHAEIGAKWVTMHPDARWGGQYDDGNHYSFIYRGRQ